MNSGVTVEQLLNASAQAKKEILSLASRAKVIDDRDWQSSRHMSANLAFWERVSEELSPKRYEKLLHAVEAEKKTNPRFDRNDPVNMALKALGLPPEGARPLVRLVPKLWNQCHPPRMTVNFGGLFCLIASADTAPDPLRTLEAAMTRAMLVHTKDEGILKEGVALHEFAATLEKTEHVTASV